MLKGLMSLLFQGRGAMTSKNSLFFLVSCIVEPQPALNIHGVLS